MAIYFVNLFSIPVWYLILKLFMKDKDKLEKWVISIVCLQMILIMGLRGLDVGVDTKTYKIIFDSLAKTDWVYVPDFYIEFGYSVMNKLVSYLGGSFNVVLTINAIICIMGVRSLIIKCSRYRILSLYMFICIGYFSSMMNIMRQYVALTFVMLAYMCVMKKDKPIKVILYFGLAFLVHDSAVVLIAFIFLYWLMESGIIKEKRLFKIIIAVCACLAVVFMGRILVLMGYDYDHMVSGAGFSYSILNFNFLLKVMLIIGCFVVQWIYRGREKEVEQELFELKFLNYLMIVSCFINIVSVQFSMFTRFNLYFSIMIIILAPNLLSLIPLKEKKLVKACVYAMLTVLFVLEMRTDGNSIVPYSLMAF